MSNSRKLKFRTVPRAPRYPHNKHAEPVPLANKFQELIEQDERSPSPGSKLPAAHRLGMDTSPPTPSMAQRLQHLLEESGSTTNHHRSSGHVAGGAKFLRNDESETVDSDTSDHEDCIKSSAKLVVPMGQRLHDLLQGTNSGPIQEKAKPRHTGKRAIASNLELKSAFREDDDIEAFDIRQTKTELSPSLNPKPPSLNPNPQPLPRIAEQFQEALMAAPSLDSASLPSVLFPVDQDYSTRLQRIVQSEKQESAEIATRGLPLDTSLESVQVQVVKKSLEGRLTTCKCQVVQAPSKWMEPSNEVQVIFNSKVAGELEIDVGRMVRINPPWREKRKKDLTATGELIYIKPEDEILYKIKGLQELRLVMVVEAKHIEKYQTQLKNLVECNSILFYG